MRHSRAVTVLSRKIAGVGSDFVAHMASMKKASLAAAFAASLSFGSMSVCIAEDGLPDEARVAEERLLGAADEEARYLAYQPFTREIAASVVIATSLDSALTDAGVPAATMLEALRAFGTALSIDRDVKAGDRFHVRYEQAFTAEGAPLGVGRVMWAELQTAARGTVAIHRFRTRDKVERLWLVNGQSATPTALRMPLDSISVSSGFGLRADPFDQPRPMAATGKAEPMGGPMRSKPLPPGLPTGGVSGNGGPVNMATPLGASLGLSPYGSWQVAPRATRSLFMHEGIDLVAPPGTPVYAAADGVIVGAAPNGRYGNWIRIDHGGKLATVYGHLMAFAPGIEPGESVVQGELIGFVGSTGRSTGAHLHFEVLSDGKPVNPITHPELKAVQLRGVDLDHFRKQVARSLEERTREIKAAAADL
jgi:murein DD-endopeptidase MepM/ murein hydrolase activator NlpD